MKNGHNILFVSPESGSFWSFFSKLIRDSFHEWPEIAPRELFDRAIFDLPMGFRSDSAFEFAFMRARVIDNMSGFSHDREENSVPEERFLRRGIREIFIDGDVLASLLNRHEAELLRIKLAFRWQLREDILRVFGDSLIEMAPRIDLRSKRAWPLMRARCNYIRLIGFLFIQDKRAEIVRESESLRRSVLHEYHNTAWLHFTP